jgi:tetratricopeptide (TPR) repeat protein
MDLVAIKYDAAWTLGDGMDVHGGAEKGFREVLELAPAFAEAHYNLGIALSHQSRWTEAASEFNRALMISPEFEMARVARDLAQRVLSGEQQSSGIEIPRYCRIFNQLYELGC